MIYSIYLLDNTTEKPLYVAGDDEKCVYNAVLNEKLNDAGSLTFTVPPTNPNFSLIEERRKVFLYEGGDKIWRGFIVSYEKNFRNELKVTCLGELAYLNDTIQPQHKYQNMTPLQLFTAYVNEHNTQATEDFTVGMVTVTDPNDSVYRYTNYESTLTALRDDLCESLEGYLRIRWENNTRYLDLVKLVDYGRANGQLIEFGSNLLDYAEGISAEDIATACLPLGAKLDTPVVNGLDAYLDIKSVNNNVDYVQDATAVAAYGLIKKVVHWDNVTVASNLKAKAIEWLTTAQYANMTLSIKAVDMSALNVYVAPKKWIDYTNEEWNELANKTWESLNRCEGYIEKFNVGDRVRCFATPYSMDATYPIQEKTTYLQDPTKNYIELSNTRKKTYTQMQYETTADVKKEQSTMLAAAQHNASEIIKSANEGNIYIKYGSDGKAEELCILDTNSPDTATKVWRWNLNGFGYSSTGYDGNYTTAITMDGGIVADFVTAGTMSCDRLNGGIINGQTINGGTINGTTINSTIGNIGGWTIDANGFTNSAVRINKDGSSTLYTCADLIIVRGHILGKDGFNLGTGSLMRHYDFNNDGRVTSVDYVRLKNLIGLSPD